MEDVLKTDIVSFGYFSLEKYPDVGIENYL